MASASLDRVCAFVPAAGLGTRLRPLTLEVPKPCIEFQGIQVLHVSLSRILDAGVRAIAVNAHHLSEQVANSTSFWSRQHGKGIDLHISDESLRLLGSADVIHHYPPGEKGVIYSSSTQIF